MKIICERCGTEKEVDVKVPKFCGKECRIASLKERLKKGRNVFNIDCTSPLPDATVSECPFDSVANENTFPNVEELQGQTNEENKTNTETGGSI